MRNGRVSLSSCISLLEIFLDPLKEGEGNLSSKFFIGHNQVCVALFNKIVECMSITSVGEFVIVGWKFLETLHSDCAEVARESSVLSQHSWPSGNKTVNQRLIRHFRKSCPSDQLKSSKTSAQKFIIWNLLSTSISCSTIPEIKPAEAQRKISPKQNKP